MITATDIAAAPRRNAEEILRQVPGFTLVQHGSEGKGNQFFLRGFDAVHGSDLELTLDGLPLNEWSNVHAQGYLDLGLIIPELVREVAVTKGPFALDQGAFAMAGSAQYRLGVPVADLGWRAAYTAGSTNRHRLFAGYSPHREAGEQVVGFEFTHDDGFGQNRGLNRATFNGRVRLVDSLEAGTIDLTGLAGYAAFELPGPVRNEDIDTGVVDFYGTYDPQSEGTSARGLVAVTWTLPNEGYDLSVTTYGGYRQLDLLENFTGFSVDPLEGDRRDQSQTTWSLGLIGTHRWFVADGLTVRTGGGLRADLLDQREDNVGQNLERLATRRDLESLQLIAHARAGLHWQPVEPFVVEAGARLDVVHVEVTDFLEASAQGQGTQWVVSPRVSARYAPTQSLRFFAAYGRGFRPPEARAFSSFQTTQTGFDQDVLVGGAPVITVSDAAELGAQCNPLPWVELTTAGFATVIERESIFDHLSGVSLELNGTRRLGGELIVEAQPISWLTLGADLTLVDARFIDSGNPVPLAPWLVAGARASVRHESGFSSGLRLLAVAPRPLPLGATGTTLARLDAVAGYRWDAFRVDLEVENLSSQRLREGEYHYTSHWRPGEPASELPALHTSAGPPLNVRLTLGVQL